MSTVNERIKTIIDNQELSVSAFAEKIGVLQQTLNNYLTKGRDPSYDVINKILTTFVDLDPTWLITGEGEMYSHPPFMRGGTQNRDSDIIAMAEKLYEKTSNPNGTPYYNVDFVGGFDLVLNDQTSNPEYYINFKPYNKPGVMWCNVTGHSMEPEINHGDMIAIKELQDWQTYMPFGEIYGIITEEHRTIKRVTRSNKEGFLRLIPTNQSVEFAPQDIPVSIILKIFKVLGNVKRF